MDDATSPNLPSSLPLVNSQPPPDTQHCQHHPLGCRLPFARLDRPTTTTVLPSLAVCFWRQARLVLLDIDLDRASSPIQNPS